MDLENTSSPKTTEFESKNKQERPQSENNSFENCESSSESSFMNSGPAQPYDHRSDFDSDSGFESSDEEEELSEDSAENWNFTVTENPNITFAYLSGVNTSASEVFTCSTPYDFFSLFVNDQIFETISLQQWFSTYVPRQFCVPSNFGNVPPNFYQYIAVSKLFQHIKLFYIIVLQITYYQIFKYCLSIYCAISSH
jgi:hypothetical protein